MKWMLAIDPVERAAFTIISSPLAPEFRRRQYTIVGCTNPHLWEWGGTYHSHLPGLEGQWRPFLDVDWNGPDDAQVAVPDDDGDDDVQMEPDQSDWSMQIAEAFIGLIKKVFGPQALRGEIQVWRNVPLSREDKAKARASYHVYCTNANYPMVDGGHSTLAKWKSAVDKWNMANKRVPEIPFHTFDVSVYRQKGSLRLPTSQNRTGHVMYPTFVGFCDFVDWDWEDVTIRSVSDRRAPPTYGRLLEAVGGTVEHIGGLLASEYYSPFTPSPEPRLPGRPAKDVVTDLSDSAAAVLKNDHDQIVRSGMATSLAPANLHAVQALMNTIHGAFGPGADDTNPDNDAIRGAAAAAESSSAGSKRPREAPSEDRNIQAAKWVLANRIGRVDVANTLERANVNVRNAAILKITHLDYGVAFTADTTWCVIKGDFHKHNKLHVVMTPTMLWCQCFSAKCREKLQNTLRNEAKPHAGLPLFWGRGAVKPLFPNPPKYVGWVADKPGSTAKDQEIAENMINYPWPPGDADD